MSIAMNDLYLVATPKASSHTARPRQQLKSIDEIPLKSLNGYWMAVIGLLALSLAGYSFIYMPQPLPTLNIVVRILLLLTGIFSLLGLYVLQPNQAALLLLFGAYRGTDRAGGLRWSHPFGRVKKISLRAHNLN